MFLISLRHLTFLRTKTKAQSHFYFSSTTRQANEKPRKRNGHFVFYWQGLLKRISEQQTALTKIKWRTKELFNPVVDFSLKRVEIAISQLDAKYLLGSHEEEKHECMF